MSIRPAEFNVLSEAGEPWSPKRVLLFSGHMIDAPGRPAPRFPPSKEKTAAILIANTLNELSAGPNDLALTQGANGSDLLFAEACQQHLVKLQLLQPFAEIEFIANSVAPAGSDWLARYYAVTDKLATPPLAAPGELGPLPANMNAYERCNLWLLESAMAYGPENVIFICLWDGGGGDGSGGTAHMVAEITKQQGRVIWLDARTL